MKVLFIISSLEAGGKERQAIELIKGLLQKNVSCELIVLKNSIKYTEIFKLNCKIYILDKRKNNKFEMLKKIYNIVKKSKPDIVQSWDLQSSVFMVFSTKILNIPFINYSIQYAKEIKIFSIFNILSKITFYLSDRVVSNSKAGLVAHRILPNNKYKYIYNGYDINRTEIKEKNLKTKLGIKTKYVIGMIGNFLDAKDYKTFILSTQKILSVRTDISIVMIGNGKTINELKDLILRENRKYYFFLENITQVEEYIEIFDIQCLICNTNGHAEGISNAIIEGMAMSKPIIATDSGGNKELVVDGYSGFIIEPFNIVELTNKIIILLDNKGLRDKFGTNGRKIIVNNFSLDSLSTQFYDLYIGLLK